MSANEKTILFIEDDQDQQRLYGLAFKKAGFRVLQALSGEDGIKIAEKEQPQIIVLDILMNGKDGIGTLGLIKKNKIIPARTPVVVFTNYTKREVLQKARDLGAADVVIKTDVVPREFVDRIEKILNKSAGAVV